MLFQRKNVSAVVFSELVVTTKSYMRTVTAVEMAWLPGTCLVLSYCRVCLHVTASGCACFCVC